VKRLAAGERRATAVLIRSLMELDARRLYLSEGCSSLFTYCTQVLHLSESAAYNRIHSGTVESPPLRTVACELRLCLERPEQFVTRIAAAAQAGARARSRQYPRLPAGAAGSVRRQLIG
jgi:hypothetical protein